MGLNVEVLEKPYQAEQLQVILIKQLGLPTSSIYQQLQAKQKWPLDDKRHLEAAEGWLELGAHIEAEVELEHISPENRAHSAVLEVQWQVLAKAKKWEAALDIASAIIRLSPEDTFGWVHRSFSLHELKRTAEAKDKLLQVVDRFPDEAIMRYNLACYECQLGHLDQARNWLEKAFKLSDPKKMKLMALDDVDLVPLRKCIAEEL